MSPFFSRFTIVIVCRANVTRSAYIAAGLKDCLKSYQSPLGIKKVRVLSAGIEARAGMPANRIVSTRANQNGFSLNNHRSSLFNARLAKKADLILVMNQHQKDFILDHFPRSKGKVFRLLEYSWEGQEEGESLDMSDPTGRSADNFTEFLSLADSEIDHLIHKLVQQQII